ncbi:MAG: DUF5107 domain-containing protein [Bryobacterales bacterium]|nr:DUF5107 domain-containing protein [Bryobacterales bacterium]
MTLILLALLFSLLPRVTAADSTVRSYTGSITIPTYEHSARELEPPLFAQSTVTGMYPFPAFLLPFKEGDPKPREYNAIFIENEYLKLTYIPEFGGRLFSLYDKLRQREVFYRNDVIKPSPYNPRRAWPQSGAELTGPYDAHMLTLHGEPYWTNQVIHQPDGAISLVLGEFDPVYQMKVNFTATLHPGVAALELSIFCYNTQPGRRPQMFWVNTAIDATPQTRFLYPMSRTVGHTTAEIADWPVFNGVDYSWDRNNRNMLGVFGIDSYDNYQGAYQFDRDYGLFRWADRRIVQGMKLWTFGNGPGAKNHERGYTDKAGPYVELQSGRHVWDGHYEWVPPHQVESWNEWWIPVAGTNGLTTITRDAALNVEPNGDKLRIAIAPTRRLPGATVDVRAKSGPLLQRTLDLDPASTFKTEIPGSLEGLIVRISDRAGHSVLEYEHPSESPGRKEYTPFTKPLEQPQKPVEQMSVEELTLAAENRFKELDDAGGTALLEKALALDPGYSRAHLQWGIQRFNAGRYAEAADHLEKAIERDPYSDVSHYYLAMARLGLGEEARAERGLYYIWPGSAYFGEREHYLARFALWRNQPEEAIAHLRKALSVNTQDLWSRFLLASTYRSEGDREAALREITEIERIDPTSRLARAERFLLTRDAASKSELLRAMGGQSQEALSVSEYYRIMRNWGDAAAILELVESDNHDVYGTPPEFYYTLAYCQHRRGDEAARRQSLAKARAAWKNIDRFPYRASSEAPLAEAVEADPRDWVAQNALASLLYFQKRPAEAIKHWEAAAAANPESFSIHRALGLAYAEQAAPIEKAAAQLESAVKLNPTHINTVNDLSALYAKAGRFEDQLKVLQIAVQHSPEDDDLAGSLLNAYLIRGDYPEAAKLIDTHRFSPRHRSYTLRDQYRLLRVGLGSRAFNQGNYQQALTLYQSALNPPESLGVDDFAGQTSPRVEYYQGVALDALGRKADARQAYERAAAGVAHLSGDFDSWNSENYFMVLSLARLGRTDEAKSLESRFAAFANGEREGRRRNRRTDAFYVLGLIEKRAGNTQAAQELFRTALEISPDFLPAHMELRGDVPKE